MNSEAVQLLQKCNLGPHSPFFWPLYCFNGKPVDYVNRISCWLREKVSVNVMGALTHEGL